MTSNMHDTSRSDFDVRPARRVSTETKSSLKTTELLAYVVTAAAVLIAAAIADDGEYGSKEAWFFVTLLTIGYMLSRGLAKSGSRDYYDDRPENVR